MIRFKSFLRKLNLYSYRRGIENALALHRRGEVRSDGLILIQGSHHPESHHLEIEWLAREIHPWDRGCQHLEPDIEFTEQSFADTDAALSRLFNELPEVDVIEFRVIHPESGQSMLAGTVERSSCMPGDREASARTRLWHRGVTICQRSSGYPAFLGSQLLGVGSAG
jgi:hypothetical protein